MEKQNPSSDECVRQDTSKSWSDLPQDLLNSVFERLGFADFQRAKSVCSSWHSASKQSVPKNQIPWLIIFPEDNNSKNSCILFNPKEKDKLYQSQDLGIEFTKHVCIATCGSWLLMQDTCLNPYIVNLFSQERINLPAVESQIGSTKIERISDGLFNISSYRERRLKTKGIGFRCPVFWIDEKTKDYVVIWSFGRASFNVVYSKNGDQFWNQIPEISICYNMVYNDHKLYFSSGTHIFTILDFSGQIPQQIFQCDFTVDTFRTGLGPYRGRLQSNSWRVAQTKLVVTVSGDVLKVKRMQRRMSQIQSFRVYKVYSSDSGAILKKEELVDSLGDEAMLLDLGITVLANGIDGFRRNNIYFSGFYGENSEDVFLFNLETREMELLRKFDSSSVQLSKSRWFLPNFT